MSVPGIYHGNAHKRALIDGLPVKLEQLPVIKPIFMAEKAAETLRDRV